MAKVSPQNAEALSGGRPVDSAMLLGIAAKVLDAAIGDDCCELGMHSGFPSIDSNVHPRMD
jgi:hypothetical protein